MANVVLVEDEKIFALDLKKTLSRFGHDVPAVFDTGTDCIEYIKENKVDIILMDIHIKGSIDGIETAKKVNAIRETPVIFLTAFSDEQTIQRAQKTSSYAFIIKPVSPPELHATIEMVLTRSKMEQEIHQRERLLSQVMESLFDMLIVTDSSGKITYINKNSMQMIESGKQILGRKFNEIFRIETADDKSINPYWLYMQEKRLPVQLNIQDYTANDSNTGKIYSINDLTEKIGYENRLENSMKQLRSVLEDDITADFLADKDGRIFFMNSNFKKLFEITDNEIDFHDLFTSIAEADTIMEKARNRTLFMNSELAMCTVNRKNLYVSANIFYDETSSPAVLKGYILDISEKKQLELQLVQSQKMEALGRLAGGVAHDINNILTIIMGFTRLLIDMDTVTAEQKEDMEGILSACRKGASLTRQLLVFARPHVNKMETFNLNTVLDDLKKMLIRLVGDNFRIDLVLDQTQCMILSDKSLIEQAVLNMVVNSRDAMPDGGTIGITSQIVKISRKKQVLTGTVEAGQYVLLKVHDTGSGIPVEIQTKILEPFFTTKEIGKGTGLGLATVYGAVKASSGVLDIESKTGTGTSFLLYFPVTGQTETVKSNLQPSISGKKRGDMILLVEDENYLLGLFSRILENHGYTVVMAQNPGEAILLCEQNKDQIKLLITDVVMAIIDGEQLSSRLLKIKPDLKVLLITGSPNRIAALAESGQFPFMQKPFEPDELVARVNSILEDRH